MTLEEWLKDQLEARVEEQLRDREAVAIQEGMQKAKQESVLELLEEYGVIPEQVRKAVLLQSDLEVLKRWLKLAASAASMEQFEKEM